MPCRAIIDVPMSNEVLLSAEGYQKLKRELEDLKTIERQRVADNIREAKSHGDLRENAMYHEAKLNQTRLEARISELERVLQFAKVVEETADADVAALGRNITLLDLEYKDEMVIELVGGFEADPSAGRISITSPLGAALMDHRVGDEIEVEAPAGTQRYRITKIE